MKYTGMVGEFKWWGFAIAMALCILFALIVFTRFDYVRETEPVTAEEEALNSAKEISALKGDVQNLEKRLAVAECKIQRIKAGNKHSKQSNDACSGVVQ